MTLTSNCTWASASVFFVEIVPTASLANGSSTLVTCGTFAIALICFSIAACCADIGPEVLVKMICPVVPEACGKRSDKVSMPRWDSVPGMV